MNGVSDYDHWVPDATQVRLYQVLGSCDGILLRMQDEGTTS